MINRVLHTATVVGCLQYLKELLVDFYVVLVYIDVQNSTNEDNISLVDTKSSSINDAACKLKMVCQVTCITWCTMLLKFQLWDANVEYKANAYKQKKENVFKEGVVGNISQNLQNLMAGNVISLAPS